MKSFLITTVVVLLLALGQPVCAQSSASSPTRAAEQFYRTYLKLKIQGLPNDNQLKILSPLITSDLKELFVTAKEIQAKSIREHPDKNLRGPMGTYSPVYSRELNLFGLVTLQIVVTRPKCLFN